MNTAKIKIQTLEDARVERQVMPELEGKTVVNAKDMTVCIMEEMTAGKQAGISFVLENPDGTFSHYIITENMMDTIFGAYSGAKQRFAKLREDRKK